MLKVACPVCEGEVEVRSDCVAGELVDCGGCGTQLEVTGVNPLTVAEAPEVEEDWGE